MALLFLSDAARGEVFRAAFAKALPQVAFHVQHAPDPAAVRWIVTWTCPDLSLYPNLEVIFSVGAGVDQFDLSAIPPQVQIVRMLDPSIAQQMCGYVTMAVLAMHRDLPGYLAQQAQGLWQDRPATPAAQRRVGVMGLGQLGLAALQALRPFGFALSGYNRSARQIEGVACFTDLPAFLAQTDIAVCLLPLTQDTRGLLNRELFAALPAGARLVHAGRGAQLVSKDLIAALDSGHLAGAVLDVTNPEPLPPDAPLWRHPKVIVTPHIATRTDDHAAAAHVVAGVGASLAGQIPPGAIDRSKGY
ncbi:2-hydroxyacid dehydrogenase [Paracoccus shanxieyensis]|uniref:Glyoxylate/hydroxypyruvate reductase A n=1 Tax=Paracoccus shanxieyensis TaxID=2675752 RepID=A0A6L6IXF2_9RHOB|nr:glyoxylate/hydroxypyruvate reductase A [Paracoccus shanxieyensis]MTH64288.1 glyoxylate/hydroxypyruvate reductase A [Paracoccus shanxieyensis]MTH87432.1 glyoxylate/hydroxypyruvate reductase A [Paracoccus shanxieyensis]